MAQKSSIHDSFISQPSSVTLTFNLPNQIFQIAFFSLRNATVPNYFEIHASIWTFLPRQDQLLTFLKFDLQV